MKIGVTDTVAIFNYIEDTISEGNGNFGQYQFKLGGNDGETTVTALTIAKTGISAPNLSGTNTGDQILPTDFVSKANGGTFDGLVSGIAPTSDLNFATKKYVDDNIPTITTPALSAVLAVGNTSGANDLLIADDQKLLLGDDSDFEIFKFGAGDNFIRSNTGDLYLQVEEDDHNMIFQGDDGSGGKTTYFFMDGGEKRTKFLQNLEIVDSAKLEIGSDQDLEIYHDGTNSHIINTTGDLTIDSQGDDLILKAADDALLYVQGTDIAIQAVGDGKVGLRYNNVEKLRTESNGVTIFEDLLLSGTTPFLNIEGSTSAGIQIHSPSSAKINMDARDSGTGAMLHKWNRNDDNTAYNAYYENWYDGNSYHSIGIESDLWRFSNGIVVSGGASFAGTVTATGFSGPLTGNVTGNLTGVASNLTVNANDTFSGTYPLMWHSGNTVYSSSFMTINGSTDTLSVPKLGVTNIVTNKIVKFNGTVLDDSNITDDGTTVSVAGNLSVSGDVSVTGKDIVYKGTNIDRGSVIFEITEFDNTNSLRDKLNNQTAGITRVDDSTAPDGGCWQMADIYRSFTIEKFIKVHAGQEYIFETWIKFVSGTDTDQRLYMGASFYDENKSYLGNSQRYWGESALQVDANTNNDGWYHTAGTLGPTQSTSTGNIPTAARWMKLIMLVNYSSNANTIRLCGTRCYHSGGIGKQMITSLYRKTIGSTVGSSAGDWVGTEVIDTSGNLYGANGTFTGQVLIASGEYLSWGTSGTTAIEGSTVSNKLAFFTQSTERMRIDSSGNVGIGTTSPIGKLNISTGLGVTNDIANLGMGSVSFANGSGGTYVPTIMSKGNGAIGLNLYAASSNTASVSDMYFNVVESDATDFSDLTKTAYRFNRAGNNLMSVLRNGNVGIGTSSPTAKLNTFESNNLYNPQILVQTDTTSVVSYMGIATNKLKFYRNVGTGVNFEIQTSVVSGSSGGHIVFMPNAGNHTPTERMRLTTAGNLGIGTGTPDEKLVVNGAIGLSYDGTNSYQGIKRTSVGNEYYCGTTSTGTNEIHTFTGSSGAKKLTILESGNVGIGTDSPSQNLEVHSTIKIGESGVTGGKLISGDSMIFQIDSDNTSGTSSYRFRCNGTADDGSELMRIQENGNVGIGTTTPAHGKLVISSNQNNSNNFTWLLFDNQGSGYGDWNMFKSGNNDLAFGYGTSNGASFTNALTLKYGGNVGITNSSPDAKLTVGPDISSSANGISVNAGAGGGNILALGSTNHNWFPFSNGQNYYSSDQHNFRNASHATTFGVWNSTGLGINDTSPSYKLDVNGTIRATADVIAYSDRRVKENIKTITGGLEKVTKLRGVSYTRKDIDDKTTKLGVIAQEVLEVLPEVVEKDDESKYSVAYGNMAGVFIEAIKELKAEVDSLKLEIKELKSK